MRALKLCFCGLQKRKTYQSIITGLVKVYESAFTQNNPNTADYYVRKLPRVADKSREWLQFKTVILQKNTKFLSKNN